MSEDEHIAQKAIDPRERDKNAKPTYWYDWVGYILIGIFLGAFNVWLNWYMYFCTSSEGCATLFWDTTVSANDSRLGYWGFFIVPFLFTIPAIIFSNMKRVRGYGYVIGYVSGGLIGMIWNPYLGVYTSSVAAILFLIIYFIFWKIWRSFTNFKIE
jgi:hypothetical protein